MQVEVAAKDEGGFRKKARCRSAGRIGAPRFLILLVCFAGLAHPADLQAAEWPWGKPDEISVKCTLDRKQIEQGSEAPLGVKAEAADSREHDLAYAWWSLVPKASVLLQAAAYHPRHRRVSHFCRCKQ